MDAQKSKAAIRRAGRGGRGAITAVDRATWSAHVARHVEGCAEFTRAHCVALYAATPDEVETAAVFAGAVAAGKVVCFPKVAQDTRRLDLYSVTTLASLRPGYRGIREPDGGMPVPMGQCDLVIVPGVVFDTAGHRIGRGGGFYDTFLSHLSACRMALAFECQLVDCAPQERHDQRVDLIVTERRVIRCDESVTQTGRRS